MTAWPATSVVLGALALALTASAQSRPAERIERDPVSGEVRITPPAVPTALLNAWPADEERQFQSRLNAAIRHWATEPLVTGTYQDQERESYPRAMYAFLAGRREEALKVLQGDDANRPEHEATFGVDFYWCLTLKGQVRKYFFFGPYLDAAYRQRMFDGAKVWSQTDPLNRPHPYYGRGRVGAMGWGAAARGACVDGRSADDFRILRQTSVYLFAEETANQATADAYRARIQDDVVKLYRYGMSDWESPGMLPNSMAGFHNLYDFARDRQCKALAKAALDWIYAAAALKYWRGGFGGPNCRDLGASNTVFAAPAAHLLYLYAGDAVENPSPDRDGVYALASAYRPPLAVLNLARKGFDRPAYLAAAKPPSQYFKEGEPRRPAYWETQSFGRTFHLGSVAGPESARFHAYNISPFKLMLANSQRGVDFFLANTTPLVGRAFKNEHDQIAQHRNLLLWLRRGEGDGPSGMFFFMLPRSADMDVEQGIWFIKAESTFLAIRPINLRVWQEFSIPAEIEDRKGKRLNPAATRHRLDRFFKAANKAGGHMGFALEVGEAPEHESYAKFKAAVKAKSRLVLTDLSKGIVELAGADGRTLKVQYNPANDLPAVWRDGQAWEWDKHIDVYAGVDGAGLVQQAWEGGTLRIQAGGRQFTCTVTPEGQASFSEK